MIKELLMILMRKFSLYHWIVRVLTLWGGLFGAALGSDLQDVSSLLKEKSTLAHVWQLSDNYSKGLTVDADPFKALAWQYVYVTLLPHAYPGLGELLKPFKAKVDKSRFDEAFDYSKSLKSNYFLPPRMDENQLIRVFQAKEKHLIKSVTNKKTFKSFDDFIREVASHDKALALRYENQMLTFKEESVDEVLVYGKLVINGAELEQTAFRNQPFDIDRFGFFIAKLDKPLILSAKGYDTYIKLIDLNKGQTLLNLGQIVLNRLPEQQLSSIVGSVTPSKMIKHLGITLKLKDQYINKEAPWFTPSIVVTTLDNGQFYIKELAAGDYELIIRYNKQRKHQLIHVSAAQVKTIKEINLL